VEAIRAVGALAQSIKEQRVKLCERYVQCAVPVAEHDAEDQALTAAMQGLIDLWDKRRLSSLDEVTRFREVVRALDRKVHKAPEGTAPAPAPPRTLKAEEVLARVEDPGVAFRAEAGALTVSASGEGKRDALRSRADVLSLSEGHRYRVTIAGAYRPASPPILAPGDELVARLVYKAEGEATLSLALRSLDDPEAAESTETWRAAAGEKAVHEAKLTAGPQQTGFYLGLVVKGAPIEVAELDLSRGGKVLLSAHPGEPTTRTDCAVVNAAGPARPSRAPPKPTAKPAGGGARPLRCTPGEGDRLTLAAPDGYLLATLRDATGPRATFKSLSLEGGRSLDATVGTGAELVLTLIGAGSATVERVEVNDLGQP
jgi:hypothetical protein